MVRDPRLWDLTLGASRFNAHEEEVLDLFREGESLAKIAKRFGMVASAVRNWLQGKGEYDRVVKCLLPECDITYSFRPRKLYCTNLHARRANARVCYWKSIDKNKARGFVHRAIASGKIERPKGCERCGCEPSRGKDGRSLIKADHHHGYDVLHHLDVWWICSNCDHEVEKLRRAGKTVNRDHPFRDDVH